MKRNATIPLSDRIGELAFRYNRSPLGENVFVFDQTMNMSDIQTLIDSIYSGQLYPVNEFSDNRFALLFKPGVYHLDVKVGYYTHVIGLGKSPEETVIIGAVRSIASQGGHVLCNFWRAVENITIIPTPDSVNTWAVSQASPLRRVYVKGNLKLYDGPSSGGFMANCRIDGTVFSGSQQQWLTRNSVFDKWIGGVWNMVYIGTINAPEENWPEKPYTTIALTPEIREKPYWVFSGKELKMKVPGIRKNSCGVEWDDNSRGKTLEWNDFYIANPVVDDAKSINKALKKGKHVLFTPGIYFLTESIRITRPGTVVIGIGFPSLIPVNGNKAIEVSDTDGIIVAGLLIDAGTVASELLMQVGEP
ncbi:MAG TPA: coagulation factor 5/8 type domain-containing protein, partial [Bacteroidales bacterium]|nr:coagulation factor 5/8 type domain-containing protein [Bacteroidales bacterium]